MKRIFFMQLFMAPIFNINFFFFMALLQGKTTQMAVNEVREKLWPTTKVNMVYWPLVQSINFRFVPLHHQVNYVACCGFIFAMFLSYQKFKDGV
mmetsp:Transcript_28953/g.21550  ORF Transcript_28953/g.21550 Transcript_28953/m.21550 type:complete len:94 (+) Transcript_28953:272-553(+)